MVSQQVSAESHKSFSGGPLNERSRPNDGTAPPEGPSGRPHFPLGASAQADAAVPAQVHGSPEARQLREGSTVGRRVRGHFLPGRCVRRDVQFHVERTDVPLVPPTPSPRIPQTDSASGPEDALPVSRLTGKVMEARRTFL